MQLQPFRFTYARTSSSIALLEPLNLPQQGLIWLTGASGSGKSTLLNLIKGLYPEFIHGNIEGENPAIAPDALYLSQNPHTQIINERVGEEFFFSMEHRQYSIEQMQAQQPLLAQYGLEESILSPTAHLSHGQAQRLLIASMLATQPKMLLLDEPTAFLDHKMRNEFYAMLLQLKQHACILLIDHYPEASNYADLCWHIDASGIIHQTQTDDWLKQIQSELLIQHQALLPFKIPPLSTRMELILNELGIGYDKKNPLFTASAHLKSGECAVLVGKNGTGKSTLFNTLAGINKALSGNFVVNYQKYPHAEMTCAKKPQAHMMYIFQHPDSHFFFDTVVEELEQLGVNNIDATLTKFGLAGLAQHSPHQLSEGQKRRLTLLFPSLLSRPLILLDEPTFGQDIINAQRITQLILALKSVGHTLIIITHDHALHHAVADQTWHIESSTLRVEHQ